MSVFRDANAPPLVYAVSECVPLSCDRLATVGGHIDRQELGALLVTVEQCKTPVDGFYAALRWAMHLDRQSVEDQERAARARSRQSLLDKEREVNYVTD